MEPRTLLVAIFDSDRSQRRALRKHLDSIEGVEVVSEENHFERCMEQVKTNPPDLLMLELTPEGDPDSRLEEVEKLKLTHPDMAVFVNSSSSAPELIMAAMRAGAQEFLQRPIDLERLRKAIEKVRKLRAHAEPTQRGNGKVITVFSKRGGLGVTTLAVNLGIAFSEVANQRTALVDLDLQLGDITSFLDLSPNYDILDACGEGPEVDAVKLQSCMTPHKSGVVVLAEPRSPDDFAEVNGHKVNQILEHLGSMYRYVVVDASHSFNDSTYSAFEKSDNILTVTVSTVSSIRATKRSLDLFRSLGYGPDKVHIVVNRVSKADTIQVSEIEKTLDYPVSWTIPNNYKVVIDAINSGVPLLNGKRPSNVGKGIMQLAEALMDGYRGELP